MIRHHCKLHEFPAESRKSSFTTIFPEMAEAFLTKFRNREYDDYLAQVRTNRNHVHDTHKDDIKRMTQTGDKRKAPEAWSDDDKNDDEDRLRVVHYLRTGLFEDEDLDTSAADSSGPGNSLPADVSVHTPAPKKKSGSKKTSDGNLRAFLVLPTPFASAETPSKPKLTNEIVQSLERCVLLALSTTSARVALLTGTIAAFTREQDHQRTLASLDQYRSDCPW
ncbi:hypothetical protein HDU86_001097 [Geranomyces michiganensis]|nr:hypothetical protein HDU86_001097 [Geranomyces michiganensis]